MKYFVVSDIHSFFYELMVALNEEGFEKDNPEHILCICGDLFDRGDDTVRLFEFVKELNAQGRLIYVKGNHEDLLFDCLEEIAKGRMPGRHHFSNGTVKTVCMLCGQSEWIIHDPTWRDKILEVMQPVLDFIDKNSVDYAEIGDYILVHGWIPSFQHLDDFRNGDESDWEEARWLNGMDMWRNPANRVENKTIICGHWHCSWGWSHIKQERNEWPQTNRKDWLKSFEPFIDDGIIAIDACTARTGKVNCIVIEK